MNENIDLTKILKDCPKGTRLYSIIYGEVKFNGIEEGYTFPINFVTKEGNESTVTSDGKHYNCHDGDCTLFPSKEQRDWSKFKPKKNKFDPKVLQPYDRVLVKDNNSISSWRCSFYSHTKKETEGIYKYATSDNSYMYCIPYNNVTKHLVGTKEEAPEYYRYWED